MRGNTKIGDVFVVRINDNYKKYFQYIISDLTQLNSDVIRAFKKVYPIDEEPALSEVVSDEVDFYAHCVTKLGVNMGYWERTGNIKEIGKTDHILFRTASDYGVKAGETPVQISYKWWVWKINEDQRYVGRLEGKNQQADIGLVMSPDSISYRIREGNFDLNYPGYD